MLAWSALLLILVMNEGLGKYLGLVTQQGVRLFLLLVVSVATLWLIVRQCRRERRISPDEKVRVKAEKRQLLRTLAENIAADLKAKRK